MDPVDQTEGGRERLGQTAIDLLDHLVEKFGEDVKIGQVVVIAEVFRGEDDGYNGTSRSTPPTIEPGQFMGSARWLPMPSCSGPISTPRTTSEGLL